jgi:hypothetical protein
MAHVLAGCTVRFDLEKRSGLTLEGWFQSLLGWRANPEPDGVCDEKGGEGRWGSLGEEKNQATKVKNRRLCSWRKVWDGYQSKRFEAGGNPGERGKKS